MNGPLCAGERLVLQSNSSNPGLNYRWFGPGGFESSLQVPIIDRISAEHAGVYSLEVSENGCVSNRGMTQVGVLIPPAFEQERQEACIGHPIILGGPDGGTGWRYTWVGPPVSGFSSTQRNVSFYYQDAGRQSGVYRLWMSQGRCQNIPVKEVQLLTRSCRNGILNKAESLAVLDSWVVYPNPADGHFGIAGPAAVWANGGVVSCQVYDVRGKQIWQGTNLSESDLLTISEKIGRLTEGLYHLVIIADDQRYRLGLVIHRP